MKFEVRQGDCVEAMRAMPAGSVDAVVTDPPYGLEFMGKEWDRLGAVINDPATERGGFQDGAGGNPYSRSRIEYGRDGAKQQEWHQAWATEALRVLRPGGHLLAFGGTRTYHRLVCAVEDAGFEIRDTICWLYGSGFPKSLNVGAAIDKAAGAEREVVGPAPYSRGKAGQSYSETRRVSYDYDPQPLTSPATPEAEQWNGWGTALKPAHEPVVVARKPLSGTVASNVLEHGCGALNVDGCRVGPDGGTRSTGEPNRLNEVYGDGMGGLDIEPLGAGRWPPNVILDEEAAGLLDEQTGELTSGGKAGAIYEQDQMGIYTPGASQDSSFFGSSGGASRFFYVAKASRAERNAGLEGFEEQLAGGMSARQDGSLDGGIVHARNHHPTVKPISLMRWLVRLVTPPGGTVCDPFTGSGTTGIAAVLEGFDFVGLEREPEYVEIAKARIAWWHKHRGTGEAAEILAAGELRDSVEATGQLGLDL